MLSTMHKHILVDSGKNNREISKPIQKAEVIIDYKKTVDGWDFLDKVIIT